MVYHLSSYYTFSIWTHSVRYILIGADVIRINFGGVTKMKKLVPIIGITILLFTIAMSGCTEQKKPVIHSFEAVPNEIISGKTTYLLWTVSDATTVTIDNGIGAVMPSGNRSITPTETTTYTLTAKSSTTVTATTTIIVIESNEKPNITMEQSEFYIEITKTNNSRLNPLQISVIVTNQNTSENQTSALGPVINEGDGNPTVLGIGDIITFSNLSDFQVGEIWTVQLVYKGDIIGQCIFKNPKAPYDSPIVRMIQTMENVTIVGIINGPLERTLCSIIATNMTNGANQADLLGATLRNSDSNSTNLKISDQITFSNLGRFKTGDRWTIQLVYNGASIGECIFTNPPSIIEIPT